MDSRVTTKIINAIRLALTQREQRYISNTHGYRNDMVYINALEQLNFEFSIRSYLFPPWITKEFFYFPDGIERNVFRYLRELLQRSLCDDNFLSNYCIQSITVQPSRSLKVIFWDGDDILENSGCMLKTCLPIYVPFYCLPNICLDILFGRKYTFDICVSLET